MVKVYIVGAGPGDLELLTLKGKRCIEEADCIVYDRLVNPQILSLAQSKCELIYLGKGNTQGGVIQDKINKTIVEKALQGKIVTRLKGGDPFVFGRGGEEILALNEAKIEFEVVPGITSSISVPSYSGIPVTHRNIARSFHVFTGHTSKEGTWHNFDAIAKLEGTLVFLMGIKNLDLIASDLMKYGKSPTTPVAIIEKGSTSKQRVIEGTLETIVEIAKEQKVVPPAIIIIGEVVNLRSEFNWFEKLPLFGKNILTTRDYKKSVEFAYEIEKLGGKATVIPLINIEPLDVELDIRDAKAILFNSQNGVKTFFEKLDDIRILGDKKIGVVGIKTYEELLKYKIKPDFMPEKYLGERLAEESVDFTKDGDKILFITSDISPIKTEEWSEKLNRNFVATRIFKTEKVIITDIEDKIKEVDMITFLSSSAVDAYIESLGDKKHNPNIKIASIGKMTTKSIKSYGLEVEIEAETSTAQGLLTEVKNYYTNL
ncbi:MAG: uroporphyrinogen-III C-methyltransferase [Psychrilyobacter sp.]|uniref:uroporphyrinogen-III C-methyltransferase n=1 Tax=Psychrilyobacter sp. TaxID=2586924 RepID=UPI003C78B6BB